MNDQISNEMAEANRVIDSTKECPVEVPAVQPEEIHTQSPEVTGDGLEQPVQ